MLEKTKAIVLNTIPYSENSVILKCYTELFGLQTYLVNGVHNKKGNIRSAHLQPLNLLELDAHHQQQKNFQRIKELKCQPVLQQLHFDMLKASVAMFIAELLNKCIREEVQTDQALFGFLFNAIQILDLTPASISNFPIAFMLNLCKYLGFQPKDNYSVQAPYFHAEAGYFASNPATGNDACSLEVSALLHQLMPIAVGDASSVAMPSNLRATLLNCLIRFYQFHLHLGEFKSHKILAEVLAD